MNSDADLPTPLDPADRWANRLPAVARALAYPPTPRLVSHPLSRRAAPRRLVYAVALAGVLVIALLAVPSTRAGLLEFIQIGVVRLRLVPPPSTVTPVAPTPPPARVRRHSPGPSDSPPI